MNKLFLSFILILPISLNAMDNSQRLLILGTAGAVGIGGHILANKRSNSSFKRFEVDMSNDDNVYSVAYEGKKSSDFIKERFVKREARNDALRATSYLAAGLLGQYAYSGKLPANSLQSYAAALAIVTGGGICGFASANGLLDSRYNGGWNKRRYLALLAGGLGVAGAGAYGLYRDS